MRKQYKNIYSLTRSPIIMIKPNPDWSELIRCLIAGIKPKIDQYKPTRKMDANNQSEVGEVFIALDKELDCLLKEVL